MNSNLRRNVLAADHETVTRVARTYLVENSARADAIISNEDLLRKAAKELGPPEIIIKRI